MSRSPLLKVLISQPLTQNDGSLTIQAWQEIETVVSYLKLLGIREPVSVILYNAQAHCVLQKIVL